MAPPTIAITADLYDHGGVPTARCAMAYADMVTRAGGRPVLLVPTEQVSLDGFDALVLTGGDDPVTEPFGVPTSEHAVRVLDRRQAFETTLIELTHQRPEFPVLGVCLGMQMMALVGGGSLNQHLPDTHTTHADHWEHQHPIQSIDLSVLPSGTVHSKHRQAVDDPGRYRVIARSSDGVIEAINDPAASFRLGVQWHPERTAHDPLGFDLFRSLVSRAAAL